MRWKRTKAFIIDFIILLIVFTILNLFIPLTISFSLNPVGSPCLNFSLEITKTRSESTEHKIIIKNTVLIIMI